MEGVRGGLLFFPGLVRRLYDWVLSWAEHPQAGAALGILALAEASFFPVPPDVLLIALSLSKPRRAFHWALICSVGSVVGGVLGYALGWQFMAAIGQKILDFYQLTDEYVVAQGLYQRYDAWAVAVAGFTPLPYKLFTISAGAFEISFWTFFVASVLSRSARFFLVAGSVYAFGPAVRHFLERYFNLCTLAFVGLLFGGYLLIKWVL